MTNNSIEISISKWILFELFFRVCKIDQLLNLTTGLGIFRRRKRFWKREGAFLVGTPGRANLVSEGGESEERRGERDGERWRGKRQGLGARSPLTPANYTVLYHSSSKRVLVEAL